MAQWVGSPKLTLQIRRIRDDLRRGIDEVGIRVSIDCIVKRDGKVFKGSGSVEGTVEIDGMGELVKSFASEGDGS